MVRDISKNQLDKRCGFSQGYASRLTTAASPREQPRTETLELVAAALETQFDYLARGREPMDHPAGMKRYLARLGYSPGEVAQRVLLARGLGFEDVAAAADRVTLSRRLEPSAPARRWLERLEAELQRPSEPGEWPAATTTPRIRAIVAVVRRELASLEQVLMAADVVASRAAEHGEDDAWWLQQLEKEAAAFALQPNERRAAVAAPSAQKQAKSARPRRTSRPRPGPR